MRVKWGVVAVLRFASPRFCSVSAGKPMTGEVLTWLVARLQVLGLIREEIPGAGQNAAVEVRVFAQPYTIRCEGGDPDAGEFKLLVRKRGVILDRLLGRAPFNERDAFVRILLEVLEREADFSGAVLEWA